MAFEIRGKVVDSDTGEEMVGVVVFVKDTPETYAITGLDGSFSLGSIEQDDILVFSFIGYKRHEINYSETKPELVVRLEADSEILNSAVVTGISRGRTEIAARNIEKKCSERGECHECQGHATVSGHNCRKCDKKDVRCNRGTQQQR